MVKGEMSAKTTYQRSAKGPVSIAECAADGKFITLENTGRKVSSDYLVTTSHVARLYVNHFVRCSVQTNKSVNNQSVNEYSNLLSEWVGELVKSVNQSLSK